MPEEINRIITDALSDYLFTSEESGNQNLFREGISREKVFFVGNTMIDTLLKHKEIAQKSSILSRLGLLSNNQQQETKNEKPTTNNRKPATSNQILPYAVLTLHRPSNVDHKETFRNILEALKEVAKDLPVIFPAHPRTLNRIKEFHFEPYFNFVSQNSTLKIKNCHLNCLDPLGYLDFLCLMSNSKLVLTDSGGMQEETTVLGIPCITLRENTERPVTTAFGTNTLAGVQKEQIIRAALSQLKEYNSTPQKSVDSAFTTQPLALNTQHSLCPPLWDGRAGQRIIQILVKSTLVHGL
jgi:UDP-N-acetylglucosamine 2-epimerase (non-hydrolysing)